MRYAVFSRKDGGTPPEAEAADPTLPEVEATEGLTCPACGLALVDTPEARAYVEAKEAEASAVDAGDVDEEAA